MHRAGLDGAAEVGEGPGRLHRSLAGRDGRAEIAESGIDGKDQRLDVGGKAVAGNNDAAPLCGDKIIGHAADPCGIKRGGGGTGGGE